MDNRNIWTWRGFLAFVALAVAIGFGFDLLGVLFGIEFPEAVVGGVVGLAAVVFFRQTNRE